MENAMTVVSRGGRKYDVATEGNLVLVGTMSRLNSGAIQRIIRDALPSGLKQVKANCTETGMNGQRYVVIWYKCTQRKLQKVIKSLRDSEED